jgi:ribosomal protein S18 acetylase RimI-like enzyme
MIKEEKMNNYIVKELDKDTWRDFELLAERHNGIWGGCWCTWFHQSADVVRGSSEDNRALKKRLVLEGRSHAALVYDHDSAIAWCQFGTPEELPAIYHKKEVESVDYIMPDWRITCLFVDKKYRKLGVAKHALLGALEIIKKRGGGCVESYPQDTNGKTTSSSFLYNGTVSLFSACGFKLIQSKGKNHTVMRTIL